MIAVDSGLFASLDPAALNGSKCGTCGTVAFPVQTGCAKCASSDLERIALPDRGSLWTWTIQAFEPKSPYRPPAGGFAPFGVGYVDLGEVIVEGRLVGDWGEFEIGMPMQLVIVPLWDNDAGEPVVSYGFAPAGVRS